jgi:phosphoserine phosphatase
MSFILTLVNTQKALTISHVELAFGFIEGAHIGLAGKPFWLDKHTACDIPIDNCFTLPQIKSLRALFDAHQIDVFCTPAQGRRKKLLLADMDATMVVGETLDDLAAHAGIEDQIAAITKRAMAGELDFKSALQERVGLLKGLPVRAIEETLAKMVYAPAAKDMVQMMRGSGAMCVLVSGGFTQFTQKTADDLGFHAHHGNTLIIENDHLSGVVADPILDKNAKENFLKDYAAKHGIDLRETLTLGDGANDLPMLLAAGLGIGYHPKPLLEETLLNVIRHSDHRAVLYAQGFQNIL